MRFDDKLSTVLSRPAPDSQALAAAWLQLVDIVAQQPDTADEAARRPAIQRILAWRDKISEAQRRLAAQSLAGRSLPPDIVACFSTDVPAVAGPILRTARMPEAAWIALIGRIPPTSRALLRERRDLPDGAVVALATFGPSDFALPTDNRADVAEPMPEKPVANLPEEAPASDISALVSRIEEFRRTRSVDRPVEPDLLPAEPILRFRFETDAQGAVIWTEGAPRGPIVGIEIATMAEIGAHGVDGQAAGAFRRRSVFRNARMIVPGAGPAAGTWLISGIPGFNEETGRFTGYRCVARRPEGSLEGAVRRGLLGPGLPPDSVRQLVHELRTPLNAIRGFAEMITGQLLGPVAASYRDRASDIIADSKRLLALFDDLDVAAKLDRGTLEGRDDQPADAADLLHLIAREMRAGTDARHIHVRLSMPIGSMPVAADALTVERMMSRLFTAVVGLAAPGETIEARLYDGADGVRLQIGRPVCLKGLSEDAMLDPEFGPEGQWPDAPALGLGFTFRLIANMAKAAKARLEISIEHFALVLPRPMQGSDVSHTQ